MGVTSCVGDRVTGLLASVVTDDQRFVGVRATKGVYSSSLPFVAEAQADDCLTGQLLLRQLLV